MSATKDKLQQDKECLEELISELGNEIQEKEAEYEEARKELDYIKAKLTRLKRHPANKIR